MPWVEITQANAFPSQTHACDQREQYEIAQLKRLHHSNSLTSSKHNNTLWYPWLSRYTCLKLHPCLHQTRRICTCTQSKTSYKTAGCKWAAWAHSVHCFNSVTSWIIVNICHYYYTVLGPTRVESAHTCILGTSVCADKGWYRLRLSVIAAFIKSIRYKLGNSSSGVLSKMLKKEKERKRAG